MPLDQLRRNAGMGGQSVNNTWHAPRNHGTREIHAVSHSIARADLDRDLVLIHQLHQLHTERNDKPVNIRPRNVLQVAARADSCLEALADHAQIQIHDLPSGHLHLIKNMIIRAAYQNTGLSESDVLHQLEILFACTDPARNLRELVPSFQALVDRIPVLLAIQEKFTLTDQSFRTAQLMQIVIDRYNLLRCIRSSRLLTVPKRRVGNPDILRHVVRDNTIIECDLRYLTVREQIVEYVRLFHIHELIKMLFQL